jgi:transposase
MGSYLYVRPYSKGQKNDFRDAEAIAEAVQRPTMTFVATKSAAEPMVTIFGLSISKM